VTVAIDTESALRQALQLTAGALQALAKKLPRGERHVVSFTHNWADLGSMTVAEILDGADTALGRAYIAEATAEITR
jgi:hypothetical protein